MTPLRWWSRAQLDAMSLLLAPAWTGWLQQWKPDFEGDAHVACELASECGPATGPWKGFAAGEAGSAWLGAAADAAVHDLIFGERAKSGPVASAVATQAGAALARTLAARLQLAPAQGAPQPGAELMRPWSGAVAVSLMHQQAPVLRLLLDGACAHAIAVPIPLIRRPAREPEPLVSVGAACRAQSIQAAVRLNPCDIDIGALLGLRVGDVIPLPHPLDRPLELQVSGQAVCAAHLGRQGRRRAIELAPSTPHPERAHP